MTLRNEKLKIFYYIVTVNDDMKLLPYDRKHVLHCANIVIVSTSMLIMEKKIIYTYVHII